MDTPTRAARSARREDEMKRGDGVGKKKEENGAAAQNIPKKAGCSKELDQLGIGIGEWRSRLKKDDEGERAARMNRRRAMESSDRQSSSSSTETRMTERRTRRDPCGEQPCSSKDVQVSSESEEDEDEAETMPSVRMTRTRLRGDQQPCSSKASSKSREREGPNGEATSKGRDEKKSEDEMKKRIEDYHRQARKISAEPTYKHISNTLQGFEKEVVLAKEKIPEQDRRHKEEVYNGMETENADIWDARAREMGNIDYMVDYVVATEKRPLGHMYFSTIQGEDTVALMKFTDFPVPSWENAKDDDRYQLRLFLLDFIEYSLRQEVGDAQFNKQYPHRYFKYELGQGEGGYITNTRALYTTRLRAIELHFNLINEEFGRAPVYVEDWTGLKPSDATLKELVYLQESVISPEVKQLLRKRKCNELGHFKCTSQCRKGRFSCLSSKAKDGAPSCCGMHEAMEMDDKDVPRFVKEGHKKRCDCLVRVECTDACACDPNDCCNRVVQRGRKSPLVIFRDYDKGWSVRGVTEFGKHDLVTEYCGRIQVGRSTGRAQQYDLSLSYPVTLPDGREEVLHISAYRQGNESSLLSHSCEPNLYAENVIVERKGVFLNRVALRARRKTVRGEELTFDYFGGRNLLDGDDFMDMMQMFGPGGCLCGAPNCRYTPEKMREAEEEYQRLREHDEREAKMLQTRAESDASSSSTDGRVEKQMTPSSTSNDSDSLREIVLRGRTTRAARMSSGDLGSSSNGDSSSNSTTGDHTVDSMAQRVALRSKKEAKMLQTVAESKASSSSIEGSVEKQMTPSSTSNDIESLLLRGITTSTRARAASGDLGSSSNGDSSSSSTTGDHIVDTMAQRGLPPKKRKLDQTEREMPPIELSHSASSDSLQEDRKGTEAEERLQETIAAYRKQVYAEAEAKIASFEIMLRATTRKDKI